MQKLLYAIVCKNDRECKTTRKIKVKGTENENGEIQSIYVIVFIIINIRVYREYENEISLKYYKVYRITIRNLKILTNEQTNIRIKYI